MSEKMLILGGTSDTANFVKHCKDEFIISVATEYGYRQFCQRFGKDRVVLRKFDEESLKEFVKKHGIKKIVDTTHPFSKEISKVAQNVAKTLNIPYESFKRETEININYEKLVYVNSLAETIDFLKANHFKNILFTIGSKMIRHFSFLKDNAYVRILPYEKSIKETVDAGFGYDRIIAIQGPFSKEFNKAIIREFNIDLLVTKLSGKSGGFIEKVEACKEMDIACLVIRSWGDET